MSVKSENVFVVDSDFKILTEDLVNRVVGAAVNSPLKRARVNFHPGDDSLVQEMIIAMCAGSKVPVHRHVRKSESFHMISGTLAIYFFNENGDVKKSVVLSAKSGSFYFRSESELYHWVTPLTEIAVFHETTSGPFIKTAGEEQPSWFDKIDYLSLRRNLIS